MIRFSLPIRMCTRIFIADLVSLDKCHKSMSSTALIVRKLLKIASHLLELGTPNTFIIKVCSPSLLSAYLMLILLAELATSFHGHSRGSRDTAFGQDG